MRVTAQSTSSPSTSRAGESARVCGMRDAAAVIFGIGDHRGAGVREDLHQRVSRRLVTGDLVDELPDAALLLQHQVGYHLERCAPALRGNVRQVASDELPATVAHACDASFVRVEGFAFAHVADPEPGVWTARIDAATVPVVENFIIREATRVS